MAPLLLGDAVNVVAESAVCKANITAIECCSTYSVLVYIEHFHLRRELRLRHWSKLRVAD